MSHHAIIRITKEVKQLQEAVDLSIAIDFDDDNIQKIRAMILGPPDTPYQFAFFEFAVKFTNSYPASPPQVQALTTNNGKCRFNPNIYACGKVCLSILGTWNASTGEQWSSAQGLESTLISIQSLMSNNPYGNEPGYEHAHTAEHRQNMGAYVAKIRHESLRIAVLQPLESHFADALLEEEAASPNQSSEGSVPVSSASCEAFIDLRKRRFLWYFDSYMQTIDTEQLNTSPKQKFKNMPFEFNGNTMTGEFNYPELRERMHSMKDEIIKETHNWVTQGALLYNRKKTAAMDLQRQYVRISEDLKAQNNFNISLQLVEENPFLWELIYLGRPMTRLDGGIFKFKIYLSPRFPDEQPRVFMEDPIFHIRISKEGVLCYVPRKNEMQSHIEAIVAALDDEASPYDPRTNVNPEATKLFWGTADERRMYHRRVRHCIEKRLE